jgi:RNA-binding protein
MGIKPRRIVHDLIGKFRHFGRMVPLTNAQIRVFKAQAQRLKATLKVGKEGLSLQFLAALDDALKHHELVKVKFDDFKEQKKELAPQLAEKSGSHLVTRVGNVVVLYHPKPTEPQPGQQ